MEEDMPRNDFALKLEVARDAMYSALHNFLHHAEMARRHFQLTGVEALVYEEAHSAMRLGMSSVRPNMNLIVDAVHGAEKRTSELGKEKA